MNRDNGKIFEVLGPPVAAVLPRFLLNEGKYPGVME
jgi:hypothetical protein